MIGKMNRKKKKIIIACTVAIVLAVLAVVPCTVFFGKTALPADSTADVYIDRDDTADSLYMKVQPSLSATGRLGWRLIKTFVPDAMTPRTGRYVLEAGESVFDVFRKITRGHQTPVKLTVSSVRTTDRLSALLAGQLMLDSAEIETAFLDSTWCETYGFEPHTIISMFLANSYEVYWNISLEGLFDRMKKEYDAYWTDTRLSKAEAIGLSPVEVITLASIVDEETAKADEKPLVAGLYINRLNKNMFLQADPTAKFASRDFAARRIYRSHLNVDSPYNTYKNLGLPPGPIRLPSRSGIESVLNHASHGYLYMCAREDFSGYHNFARTYSEHQANARRYHRALNSRNIK